MVIKTKWEGKGNIESSLKAREFTGVGFVLNEHKSNCIKDYEQYDGRNISVTLQSHHNPIHIINTYAPQSKVGKSEEQRTKIKQEYYDTLQYVYDQFPSAEVRLVYGDFNASIQHRQEHEQDVLGPHIFGKGKDALEKAEEDVRENRELFLDFCRTNELHVMNTYIEKPPEKQCTRKELNT